MKAKRIPFVEMPAYAKVDAAPPDGNYAVISYRGSHKRISCGFMVKNPFPWHARVYIFAGGVGDDIGCGSNPGDVLSRYDIAKVFLVGLSAELRNALQQKLSKHHFELVPEPVAQ